MSTPFPPNSRLKGLSAYAPPRLRDRALSQSPAEIAEILAQSEAAQADAEQTERNQTPEADLSRAKEAGTAKDAMDWLDDAIRAVIELEHVSPSHVESDPPAPPPSSVTPRPDETDDWPPSGARRSDGTLFRNARPRPPGLEMEIVPPPPPPESGRLGQILRMSFAIVLAAIVAYGVTRFYPSRPGVPHLEGSNNRIAEFPSQQTEAKAQIPSRLVVEDQQAFANEPVSLAVNVEHAMGNESLLLDGLAQGTTLSAGTSAGPSDWQLPPDKLAGLYLYAPKDFVGVMNTTVKLLDPDKRLLDSRIIQLTWISKPPRQTPQPALASAGNEAPAGLGINPTLPNTPAVRPIDPSDAAMLMQRGRDSLATGDISAARVAFRRLADAGMPDAALALANTYDPTYLAAHNVVGGLGDRGMARTLYQRAKALGSTEAGRILGRMGIN